MTDGYPRNVIFKFFSVLSVKFGLFSLIEKFVNPKTTYKKFQALRWSLKPKASALNKERIKELRYFSPLPTSEQFSFGLQWAAVSPFSNFFNILRCKTSTEPKLL